MPQGVRPTFFPCGYAAMRSKKAALPPSFAALRTQGLRRRSPPACRSHRPYPQRRQVRPPSTRAWRPGRSAPQPMPRRRSPPPRLRPYRVRADARSRRRYRHWDWCGGTAFRSRPDGPSWRVCPLSRPSIVIVRVSESSAALAAAQGPIPGEVAKARMLVTLTMAAPLRACSSASRAKSNAPMTFSPKRAASPWRTT